MTSIDMPHFKHSYQSLPAIFFAAQNPEQSDNPKCVLYNMELAKELGIQELLPAENAHKLLSGNIVPEGAEPIAQAYAGHQFGYPNMLGDGRALLLGEWETPEGNLVDIVLKGSGKTPFSRGGDGRATLKAILREYLMSEAMHGLGIATSRSLAVVKTGNRVQREQQVEGAILTRIMSSHIRVGTFEFAKGFGSKQDMGALIDYTIKIHYPELSNLKNPALGLLQKVIDVQINLVTQWLRVGFINGVMNTDNTSIGGETFDYGPCAFMSDFHSDQVFSSIDTQGRYAFGNQANIILWNVSVFASTLSDFIDEATIASVLGTMGEHIHSAWLVMMCQKLGILNPLSKDEALIRELLSWMQDIGADYTNTFLYIGGNTQVKNKEIYSDTRFIAWQNIWKDRVSIQSGGFENAQESMKQYNPVYIPRNHLVEHVLEKTVSGDNTDFLSFLEILKNPYMYRENTEKYMESIDGFDEQYQTYCGT
ncbi:YdiU family protein [Candidatus Gracilibacteria bacterium]|nr:YdiU family protein [Candidatus Gracilibacteria bacterium]